MNPTQKDLWSQNAETSAPSHPHPGRILAKEFLEPLNLTQYRLAKDTGLTHTTVTQIVQGKRAITVETALRLSRYFGNSPEFWLNLQRNHDLRQSGKLKKRIQKEVQPL